MQARRNPTAGWQVHPLQVAGLTGNIPVTADGITFGRDAENTVTLSAEDFPGVSGKHARLDPAEDTLVLRDLGSMNGTLVQGKPVQEHVLGHGEAFELGAGGPRFMVLSSTKMDKTVSMPVPDLQRHEIGTETMRIVKQELGLPEQKNVQQLVRSGTRRNLLLIVLIAILVAGGGSVAYIKYLESETRTREELQERTADLEQRLEAGQAEAEARLAGIEEQVRGQIEEHFRTQQKRLADARTAWEEQKATLEGEQSELKERIQQLLEEGEREESELADLRKQLDMTSRDLAAFNPVNLEAERLARVAGVERSVVLIETTRSFRDKESGKQLYVDRLDPTASSLNLAGRGELLTMESSGSGFVVSEEGWIITNAHVVSPQGQKRLAVAGGMTLVPEVSLQVVYSGTSKRHDAELVRMVYDDRKDLALLKIEPFPGMPFLPEPDLKLARPRRGSDVFLIGFPLGKAALQQGDTVIASTFRGIVSRSVDEYIQVDAAVHPGASGGPLIDSQGRILGVVVGMQAVSEEASSSAIGYIIPVAKVAEIWPPEGWGAAVEAAAHSDEQDG